MALLIEDEHNRQFQKGVSLPGKAQAGRSKSVVRIACNHYQGIDWQYGVNLRNIHAEIHFQKTRVQKYDDYAARFSPCLEFDETEEGAIVGNTLDKSRVTRKLRLTLNVDDCPSDISQEEIARLAIKKMEAMYAKLSKLFA